MLTEGIGSFRSSYFGSFNLSSNVGDLSLSSNLKAFENAIFNNSVFPFLCKLPNGVCAFPFTAKTY